MHVITATSPSGFHSRPTVHALTRDGKKYYYKKYYYFKVDDAMRTIEVSDPVWKEIAKRGKFGETEDDVMRRVFEIPPGSSSLGEVLSSLTRSVRKGPSSPRRSFAVQRMSCNVDGNQLYVSFQGGPSRTWTLPLSSDKPALRNVREKAVAFARENRATLGQVNAVKKALTDNGYHLTK